MLTTPSVQIHAAMTAQCNRNWFWDSRLFPFRRFNLWLVTTGRGELTINRKTFSLKRGDVFLHRNWEHQQGFSVSDELLTVPFIVFDWVSPNGSPISADKTPLLAAHIFLSDPSFIHELMSRCISNFSAGNLARASLWLHSALEEYKNKTEELTTLPGLQSLAMRYLADTIRSCPAEKWTLAKMARTASYSVNHLLRLFKTEYKTTPIEFLICTRIEQAKSQLICSSNTISQIAENLGYPDIYTFSRQFKQKTGLTPTAFRNSTCLV